MAESEPQGWHRSTASAQGNCVEVAILADAVLVRDSKDHTGPALTFTYEEWRAFVIGVHNGEFDLSAEHPSVMAV